MAWAGRPLRAAPIVAAVVALLLLRTRLLGGGLDDPRDVAAAIKSDIPVLLTDHAATAAPSLLSAILLQHNSTRSPAPSPTVAQFVPYATVSPGDWQRIKAHLAAAARLRVKTIEKERTLITLAKPLRGISWVYKYLDGMLLGSPELFYLQQQSPIELPGPANISFHIEQVNEGGACNPVIANKISIWVRVSGPEILATLAVPIAGECKWRATFFVSYAGNYAAMARLLHYGDVSTFDKPFCSPNHLIGENETSPYPELFRNAHLKMSPLVCCEACPRFDGCIHARVEKKYQCVFYGNVASKSAPRSPWQLGCGQNNILSAQAPCGSFISYSVRRQASEDVIFGEWDSGFQIRMPISPSEEADLRPLCRMDSPHVRGGHWVRIAPSHLVNCSVPDSQQHASIKDYVYTDFTFPSNGDPLCWLRVDMHRVSSYSKRDPVYATELSALKYLAVHWQTRPSAPCRMPLPMRPELVRSCLLNKGVRVFDFSGMSVIATLRYITAIYINAAFNGTIPELPRESSAKIIQIPAALWGRPPGNHTVFVTNLAAPWKAYEPDSILRRDMDEMLNGSKKHRHKKALVKAWVTPALSVWERRHRITAERSLWLYRTMRPRFVDQAGFLELDFLSMSFPWVFDLTVNMDTVHYQGQVMMELAFALVHAVCEAT